MVGLSGQFSLLKFFIYLGKIAELKWVPLSPTAAAQEPLRSWLAPDGGVKSPGRVFPFSVWGPGRKLGAASYHALQPSHGISQPSSAVLKTSHHRAGAPRPSYLLTPACLSSKQVKGPVPGQWFSAQVVSKARLDQGGDL